MYIAGIISAGRLIKSMNIRYESLKFKINKTKFNRKLMVLQKLFISPLNEYNFNAIMY